MTHPLITHPHKQPTLSFSHQLYPRKHLVTFVVLDINPIAPIATKGGGREGGGGGKASSLAEAEVRHTLAIAHPHTYPLRHPHIHPHTSSHTYPLITPLHPSLPLPPLSRWPAKLTWA